MAYSPQFFSLAINETEQISTANTARDGSGSVPALVTGAAPATIIEAVFVRAQGTTTAGFIRLFYRQDSADDWWLLSELTVAALTPSSTIATFAGSFSLPAGQIYLPDGAQIGVSTHNAETFNVFAQGGRQ